jgi:hypothetical protein
MYKQYTRTDFGARFFILSVQISVCRTDLYCHPERVAERSESQIIMIAGGNHTLIEAQRSRRIRIPQKENGFFDFAAYRRLRSE